MRCPTRSRTLEFLRHCVLLEWQTGRSLEERRAFAERAVEIARVSNDRDEIARALANYGGWHRSGGRFDEAESAFAEAYTNAASLSRIAANVLLRMWAVTDLQRGNVERARARFTQVVRSERPGSETHASALVNLGELEYAAGNVEAARDAARRARETYAALGSSYLVVVVSNLGAYALAANDLQEARVRLHEALDLLRLSGPAWVSTVLEHHALLAAMQGDRERAATLLGFTDARFRARGEVRQQTERRGYERLAELLTRADADGQLEQLTKAGERLSEEEALAAAAAIYGNTDPQTAV